jgi:hypothetical protein
LETYMLELVKNKHFSILIDPTCEMVGNRMFFHDVQYTRYSTRATKFQMKKAMKRKIHKVLWEYIRRGDTVKGCGQNDHIEGDFRGSEGLSSS